MKYLISILMCSALFSPYSYSEDNREVLDLSPEPRRWVIEFMRQMLETLTAVQGKLADGDLPAVQAQVSALETFQKTTKPPRIGRSFPDGFKTMAHSMNDQWQVLGKSESVSDALRNSQQLMNYCNACHRSYRLTDSE